MSLLFFFNDTATTEIYTLSLHDALPIWDDRVLRLRGGELRRLVRRPHSGADRVLVPRGRSGLVGRLDDRSEEHTSGLQSPCNLVCRLLLAKKTCCGPAPGSFRRRYRPED